MSTETIQCPKCPKLAIRRFTGVTPACYPPQDATEWWCGCGWRRHAGGVLREASDDTTQADWEAANR